MPCPGKRLTRRVSLDRRHWLLSAGQNHDGNDENKDIDSDDYGNDIGGRPSDRTKAWKSDKDEDAEPGNKMPCWLWTRGAEMAGMP